MAKIHEIEKPFLIDCIIYHLNNEITIFFEPKHKARKEERWQYSNPAWPDASTAMLTCSPHTAPKIIRKHGVHFKEICMRQEPGRF